MNLPALTRPHHDSSARYVDEPNPSLGDVVTVSIEVSGDPVGEAWLRHVEDGEQGWIEGVRDGDRIHFELPCTQDVVNYRFHVDTADGPRWLNGLGLVDYDPTDASDFRLLTTGAAPSWISESVWYQIFPDRFATSGKYRSADGPDQDWVDWANWDDPVADSHAAMTQLYGGDLDGVTSKLQYLADLGIGGIYLNPVFPARSNHRYDALSFDRVDPLLGGDDALVRLSAEAENVGLKVMTDLTLNHTGDGHEWFKAAQADAESPEAGFYHFIDHPDRYESWFGVPSLPKLDHRNEEMRRRYYEGPDSILARYLQPPFNMAGWRIDVANMTGRLGPIDLNQNVAKAVRNTMRSVAPDAWLVGEHFFDASQDAPGDGWHGVMNYSGITRPIVSWLGEFTALSAFTDGPGQSARSGIQMARTMDAVRAAMPWQVSMGSMTLLGSHDTARWRTMAMNDDVAIAGLGLLLSMPGTPTILYGDEVGLEGATSEKARVPMPWDEGQWDGRFLSAYQELIRLRNTEPALRSGGFRWVHTEADAIVFCRETADKRLLVRAARAGTAPLSISTDAMGARSAEALFGAEDMAEANGMITLDGDGPSFSVWRLLN